MSAVDSAGADNYVENILNLPERPDLERLAKLAGHLFRAPVSYLALVNHSFEVVSRIGPGTEVGSLLQIYPRSTLFHEGRIVRDSFQDLAEEELGGGLRFFASAPLLATSGISLGALVIADYEPRPQFGKDDASALAELAGIVAAKMEFRMIAAHARESELALRETEERFRAIADSAPVLILCSGPDGASTFVNQTFLDFTGRTLEEELADGGAGCVHPHSRKIVYETYWRAFQARQPVTVEFPMRRYDGKYRWMLCRGVPRFRPDGSFAGFIGTLVDFTNHYQAIAEVQKHALCASAVANAGGLTYLLLDPHGRIEQANSLVDPIAGGDARVMIGTFLWETELARRNGANALRSAVERAATGRKPVELQTHDSSAEETAVPVTWRIVPIVSAADELIALVATAARAPGP